MILDRSSAVPLYFQIYQHLLDQIRSGALQPGQPIPSEPELAASIFKNTKITERVTSQFRAEFFNALNHTNFAEGFPVTGMSTYLPSSLFGQF